MRIDEGDGKPLCSRTPRPADAVNIPLRILRQIIIEYMRDALDVESARRDVGDDEDLQLRLAETAHDEIALRLREVAVQLVDEVAAPREFQRHMRDLLLRMAEDHRKVRLIFVQQLTELVELRILARVDNDLLDIRERHALGLHRNLARLLHVAARERPYALGHRRRKEHELVIARQRFEHRFHILDKAKTHELVGLIEDDLVDL